MIDVITLCDYIGTFAFAVSGIRLASAKNFDWFGAYVVGVVTAVGGGTLRDILIGATPFWMIHISYLIISALALLFIVIFRHEAAVIKNTFFLFDTIGLCLFTVVGIEKTLQYDFSIWVAIVMGMVTGAFGGMLRDILINEVPLIFRQDIYASACVAGGLVYWGCESLSFSPFITYSLSAGTVFLLRMLAMKYHISLPILKGDE